MCQISSASHRDAAGGTEVVRLGAKEHGCEDVNCPLSKINFHNISEEELSKRLDHIYKVLAANARANLPYLDVNALRTQDMELARRLNLPYPTRPATATARASAPLPLVPCPLLNLPNIIQFQASRPTSQRRLPVRQLINPAASTPRRSSLRAMFSFKRLSRASRSNSYNEDYERDRPRSRDAAANADYGQDSPSQSTSQHNNFGPVPPVAAAISSPSRENNSRDMYPRSAAPQDPYPQQRGVAVSNGVNSRQNSVAFDGAPTATSKVPAQAPDLLTRAFHEALGPYTDKIEQLETQMADLQAWAETLEQQRNEMYAWVDKRGLRPDVPPSIAKAMDSQPDAAVTLNAQLDRKITIVNFDLHRLQDDLNDSISSSHFAAAMSKFLPDISRLASLPGGARYAFDLILKLGGNLNSHGGLDPTANTAEAAADISARRDFYARLDTAMVEVVRRRFQEGEDWPIGREIKRIEKTAAYLRNYGIDPYFPATLDAMRREIDFRHGAAGPGASLPPAQSPPKY